MRAKTKCNKSKMSNSSKGMDCEKSKSSPCYAAGGAAKVRLNVATKEGMPKAIKKK